MILEVIKISTAIILVTIASIIVLFLFYFVWQFIEEFKKQYQLKLKEANVSTFKELKQWKKKQTK